MEYNCRRANYNFKTKSGGLLDSQERKKSKPIKINQIDGSAEVRMRTGDKELDNVLGGGIVPGSLTLLGGEPGIGKKHTTSSNCFKTSI